MGNELAQRALESDKKSSRLEPEIKETNLTFFCVMFINAFLILIAPALYGTLNKNAFIGLALLFLMLSIPLFILGHKFSGKKKTYKAFYYFDFLFISVSVLMSCLAILTHYKAPITAGTALMIAGGIAFLAVLDFVILSTGKKERLFFSLTSFIFLGIIVFSAIILFKYEKLAAGIPMLVFSVSLLILHLTMLIHICSGNGFFAIMSFTYLIVAIIALIVAILVVAEGDCDCSGCDCMPIEKGGRRGKIKRLGQDITK